MSNLIWVSISIRNRPSVHIFCSGNLNADFDFLFKFSARSYGFSTQNSRCKVLKKICTGYQLTLHFQCQSSNHQTLAFDQPIKNLCLIDLIAIFPISHQKRNWGMRDSKRQGLFFIVQLLENLSIFSLVVASF